MKKNKFIEQLIIEEKIKLTNPSKDVSLSYSQKSKDSIRGAKVLLKENLLDQATSTIYYAMYYKVLSLLFLIGIKCENHTGSIILLKDLFNVDNLYLLYSKKERVDKQYYTDFEINNKEVIEMIEKSELFIDELDIFIDKLNEKQKNQYYQDFKITYF